MKFLNLKNKKIIINGGLGLIGQELSKKLLLLGAKIYIIDFNLKQTKIFTKKYKKFYSQYKIYNYDTSSKSDLKKIINLLDKIGIIHSYINLSYPKDDLWHSNNFKQIKLDSFLKNINMNSISYCWLTKIVAEKMKRNKFGSIILFSSIFGIVAQDLSIYKNTKIKENITYSFIKGGIVNYTRILASYYGKFNLRINAISPGGVKDIKNINQDKVFIKNYNNKVPLKRLARPEEIANVAIFLSSEASSYITGSNIVVDGGWTSI